MILQRDVLFGEINKSEFIKTFVFLMNIVMSQMKMELSLVRDIERKSYTY